MELKRFYVDDVQYSVDRYGVVHQTTGTMTQVYDHAYVAERYDSLPDHGRGMSLLRIGYLVGVLRSFRTVLDVGYGNGDFLASFDLWRSWGIDRYGLDVSNYPLPKGCIAASKDELCSKSWDLVTFFDSFEHIADISFVSQMRARHIALTVPMCHLVSRGVEWFRGWKHRRPGEHLHHFDLRSLTAFMHANGYRYLAHQNLEDGLRPSETTDANTLTAVFQNANARKSA